MSFWFGLLLVTVEVESAARRHEIYWNTKSTPKYVLFVFTCSATTWTAFFLTLKTLQYTNGICRRGTDGCYNSGIFTFFSVVECCRFFVAPLCCNVHDQLSEMKWSLRTPWKQTAEREETKVLSSNPFFFSCEISAASMFCLEDKRAQLVHGCRI